MLTWGCRILTLHLNFVAGYTGPLTVTQSQHGFCQEKCFSWTVSVQIQTKSGGRLAELWFCRRGHTRCLMRLSFYEIKCAAGKICYENKCSAAGQDFSKKKPCRPNLFGGILTSSLFCWASFQVVKARILAFTTWNSNLIPSIESLYSSNPYKFEFSVFGPLEWCCSCTYPTFTTLQWCLNLDVSPRCGFSSVYMWSRSLSRFVCIYDPDWQCEPDKWMSWSPLVYFVYVPSEY